MPPFVIVASVILSGALLCVSVLCLLQARKLAHSKRQLAAEAQRGRQAEEQHRLMFSANPSPMWIYDCETLRFLMVNDAAVHVYGYSREEFLQMTLRDIRPPEEVPALVDFVRKYHRGLNAAGVWRHRRKDGRLFFAEVKAFGFEEDGHRRELIQASDVSEHTWLEGVLRQSQVALQSLLDNAPIGIFRSSFEGDRYETLNQTLREILGGYSLEEALRLKLSAQLFADPEECGRMTEILRRNVKIQGYESTFRRRDGSTVRVRLSGSLIRDVQGEEHFEGYVEDISQQSSLEQQVRRVQKLEAVGRLAGGMAHDFNNILVVIKLSTEMMLAQITPDNPLSKPLLQVSNAADRAAALTRQMLAFGRQQVMQTRIINLNAVVSETSHMLRRLIGEDIQLVTNLSDSVENSRLDPDQLAQVILNLAVNARDAMPEGGTLHLETATVELDDAYSREHPPVRPGRYVMLAVSDTGTGIDKSVLPHIFDPFFTTKDVGKGTGLGLAIVYGIVKQSGGYVWAYSELGHGTTVKLYFPATTAAVENPVLRNETAFRPSGQIVLVVEDEATIRSNVRLCLEHLGYHVLEADSADAALQTCARTHGQIDLVLSDLVMPGMGGYELAGEISRLYPEVKMLFMSGYTEDSAARRDILMRGSPFLQKPFSVADLSSAVHQVLALPRVRE